METTNDDKIEINSHDIRTDLLWYFFMPLNFSSILNFYYL